MSKSHSTRLDFFLKNNNFFGSRWNTPNFQDGTRQISELSRILKLKKTLKQSDKWWDSCPVIAFVVICFKVWRSEEESKVFFEEHEEGL